MGIMNNLFGSGSSANTQSASQSPTRQHAIDKAAALAPTDGQAFSPNNPGNFESIRTIDVVGRPQYFTREEANQLGKIARGAKSAASATKRAYKHLKRIDDADTTVHESHYRYARRVAGNETRKIEANQKYARRLHGLRPRYFASHAGLEATEKLADSAIAQLKAGLK